jgi:hypothetical protein
MCAVGCSKNCENTGVLRKKEQILLAQNVVCLLSHCLYWQGAHLLYNLFRCQLRAHLAICAVLHSASVSIIGTAALYSASMPIIGTFIYRCCFIFCFGANYWHIYLQALLYILLRCQLLAHLSTSAALYSASVPIIGTSAAHTEFRLESQDCFS